MSANYRSESETLGSPLLPAAAENLERSYFEVLGLCCSSEVALIENILKPLQGVKEVYVIVPSKTVIVVHDSLLISALQIVNVLNKARLEANIRAKGDADDKKKWPSPNVIICGLLLALSFLKYLYQPFQWVALGAVAVGIFPILMRAFVAVRNFTLDVNVLMLLAVVGTTALSDFLEAGTIVFLFTIAQWLESKASHKANAVMTSLMSLAPQKAVIAGTGESVDVQDVKMNTILAVKAGETVPLDGLVVDGNAEVDEKMLTGESFPVNKEKDFIILAGTIVLNGYVSVMTTALAENCVVARMAKLVEEAQNRKSKTQRLIDTCSKYYTPVVVLISACIAAIPAALRVPNQSNWFHLALVVLVSACPCGLILSTPVATFCALSQAASIGLLFKGGDYLEILAKTKVVAFDKTGTITKGEFLLTDFDTLSNDVSINTLLYWVSSIESKSSHPISTAVVNYAESLSIRPKPENVQDFKSFPGEGVCGKIDGCEIYIGNKKFGGRAGCVTSRDMEDPERDGRSLGYIYSGGALIGSFRLSDIVRLGAIDAVSDLNSMGIRTAMLTGDSHAAAMHVQNELQQGLAAVYAELLPEEKAQIIHEFKNIGPTVMVGDGVNDAPALATADIGISMGVSGSALAMETGHVILMSNDIRKIPKAVQLARNTRRKVIENLFFSIVVKAAVLALAFAGHPIIWVAVLADVLTCLLVISNSMLLLRGSYNYGHNQKCQRSPIPGHSQNKCANTKAECKSSKCASLKCARSSEPVKCKDAAEHCRGGDKQRKHCCSQNICQAKLGRSSQEPAELCQGIPDDSSSSRNKTCINSVEQQPEQGCSKTITCSEKSCCVDDVVCCEDMAERQGSCQEDEHLAGGRCCDHEMEAGGKQGQFKQLDDPPTLAGAMNIHPHQHELKCCGNERVMEETQPEIETEAQTCARGIGGQKDSSGCEEHCSRVCHKADNLHGASQGHAMPKHACVSLGSTGSGACCSRSSRKECCASSAGCGGCLSEIVIE